MSQLNEIIEIVVSKKCPICEKYVKPKLDDETDYHDYTIFFQCTNDCFTFDCSIDDDVMAVSELSFFDNYFPFSKESTGEQLLSFFKSELEYWRKDHRYLMEILERR